MARTGQRSKVPLHDARNAGQVNGKDGKIGRRRRQRDLRHTKAESVISKLRRGSLRDQDEDLVALRACELSLTDGRIVDMVYDVSV